MAKDEKSSSIFGKALLATPAVVGAGITFARMGRVANMGGPAPTSTMLNQAQGAIREFAGQYASRSSKSGRTLLRLRNLADENVLTPSQIREAAYEVAANVDPTGTFTDLINRRLGPVATSREAMETLEMILNESDSIYTQRAARRLAEDLTTLSDYASHGGTIDPIGLQTEIPRLSHMVPPGEYPPWMTEEIQKIQTITGGANIGVKYVGRADLPGREMLLSATGGNLPGPVELRIPGMLKDQYRIQEGPLAGMRTVVSRGMTQQSRYITGVYGLVEHGTLKKSYEHEHWMLFRAAEELFPQLVDRYRSAREAQHAVRTFESEVMEDAEFVHTVDPLLHGGPEEYIKARSSAIRLYERAAIGQEKFVPLGIHEYAAAIYKGLKLPEGGTLPLYPGTGPSQVSGAVAQLTHGAEGMTTVPYAFPGARRPLQSVREGYSPAADAIAAMEANPVNRQFAWAMREKGVLAPMEKMAFVSSRYDEALQGTGWSSEGMAFRSTRRLTEQRSEAIKQYIVSSEKVLGLRDYIDVSSGTHWDINKRLGDRTVLGRGPGGELVSAPAGTRLLSATAFENDMVRGNFIRVMAAEEEGTIWAKVFGTTKAVVNATTDDMIRRTLNRTGHATIDTGSHPIDILVTMDELRKNRSLHYDQMFTSLYEFSRANMDSGMRMMGAAESFAADPYNTIRGLTSSAMGPAFHETMASNIFGIARGAGLSPQQMGRVFGAVPEVYSEELKKSSLEQLFRGPLSPEELREISLGIPTGWGQVFHAGTGVETGAGKPGTLEPRAYELLGSPHWGPLGKELQADIAQRMLAASPERMFEQQELARSLSSITNLQAGEGAWSAAGLLGQIEKGRLLPSAASSLKTGIGDIYIPGEATMRQLASYQTDTGLIIDSPLAHAYRDVIEASAKYGTKDITRNVLEEKLSGLSGLVQESRLGTVMAKGGLLRGPIPGSMSLRAVVAPAGVSELLKEGELGITTSAARQMFDEMRRLGIYDPNKLTEMEEDFYAGLPVEGLSQRHPHISPYSTQTSLFRKVPGTKPVMMYNEERALAAVLPGKAEPGWYDLFGRYVNAVDRAPAAEQAALARQLLEAGGGEILGTPLRLSSLVGQAGDFDADNVSAIFAGPQMRESIWAHMSDPATSGAYMKYSIRKQIMKAKGRGAAEALSLNNLLAGSTYAMSTTSSQSLGRLSNLMQEYRGAALAGAGGLSPEKQMNVLGLMDWLEQEPISGKHIAAGREEEVLNLFSDLRGALTKRSPEGIAQVAISSMESAKTSGRAALFEGFTVAMRRASGKTEGMFIPGIDVSETAANAVASLEAFESTGGSRIRQLLMKKGPSAKAEEALSIMSEEGLAKSPFGSFFEPVARQENFMANLSKKALAVQNRMASAGEKLIAHARPLAIGLGASIGLSMLLSSPPRSLEAGAKIPPQPNLRSGTGGENIGGVHQDSTLSGAPTAPNLTGSMHSARVAPNEGFNINIRGNTSRKIDYGALNSQIRRATGRGARVNATVSDRRGSLTPQRLSSILRGR